jgi:hypothetical protein
MMSNQKKVNRTKVTLELPTKLYIKTRHYAIDHGSNMTETVINALANYLEGLK